MKKRGPSNGQNGELVHWWVLVHVGTATFLYPFRDVAYIFASGKVGR
jgi:hypothetical protein